MAGDWLKIEKATPRKPEVLRISVALGIHPDEAFGLCFRFWSWCDDQLSNGNAVGVTEALVDALVGRAGFAAALVDVGWLQVRSGSLVIPHFDRHLSQSAKTRALTAKRVAKHKHKDGHAEVTVAALPEKRRENKEETHTRGREGPADGEQSTFMTGPSPEFLRFWEGYPRKIGRSSAWEQWYAAVSQVESEKGLTPSVAVEWLIGKGREFAASKLGRTGGVFIPAPAKFLSEHRFFDDPAEWEKDHGNSRRPTSKPHEQSRFESSINVLADFASGDEG